jgi:hypothetical protein
MRDEGDSPEMAAELQDVRKEASLLLAAVLPLPRVVRPALLAPPSHRVCSLLSPRSLRLPQVRHVREQLQELQGGACNRSTLTLFADLEERDPMPSPQTPLLSRATHLCPQDRLNTECFHLQNAFRDAQNLDVEHRRLLDQQTNNALYTLTVLSAIFTPANFLAAVYGMNFEFMPELGYRHGYLCFWVAILCVWCGFVASPLGLGWVRWQGGQLRLCSRARDTAGALTQRRPARTAAGAAAGARDMARELPK